MPYYRVNGMMVHLNLSGKARKNPPKACQFFVTIKGRKERCMQMASYLCDWPGCDAPICEDHRLALGPELDVCPHHNARRGLLSRLLPAPGATT
jgi:hypothetical protein